jgi:hypothetical protein
MAAAALCLYPADASSQPSDEDWIRYLSGEEPEMTPAEIDAQVAKVREALASDAAGTFRMLTEGADLAKVSERVRVARDYRSAGSICSHTVHQLPDTQAEIDYISAWVQRQIQCLNGLVDAAPAEPRIRADKFAMETAAVAAMSQYACSRKPGPACIPDAGLRPLAETFNAANLDTVKHAARLQKRRDADVKELWKRLVDYVAEINAYTLKRNEARSRETGSSTRAYTYRPLPPPPTQPVRRDTSVSAPGMR